MKDIFRQIAKENGTTEKAVKEEMQFAIREAMKSAEPEAIAFWKAVAPDGKEPPIEKVIAMIALNVIIECIIEVLRHLIFIIL